MWKKSWHIRLNALLTKWVMKSMVIKQAYTKQAFEEMVSKSKFGSCEIWEDHIELEIRRRDPRKC
ncbi:hypothetical protein GCM10007416_30280 [Kroppenstedtia guangzhouensis]|uniref:Uncharacterized protein n=1 Tax=Kroppenstedtia guangzhouensis TaxID=1274356 RepID=A0ABQ1H0Y0_9BACL|nr:hypothetical protein GCM10007416_30280 [Kroppenstedtia guangzhouensis]